jgi:hypothetical protein
VAASAKLNARFRPVMADATIITVTTILIDHWNHTLESDLMSPFFSRYTDVESLPKKLRGFQDDPGRESVIASDRSPGIPKEEPRRVVEQDPNETDVDFHQIVIEKLCHHRSKIMR